VDKDPVANTVTVGAKERLLARTCVASEANWLTDVTPNDWRPCRAQHRYNSAPVQAHFRVIDNGDAPTPSGRAGRFEVEFDKPQSAVTPGQAIVLYDDTAPEVVIGGGWIESSG